MFSFVRFTLRQRVLLNLLFVLLMVIGAFAILRSPVERYPNIHFGKVMIDTYYPGASPQDVEALITRKIEDALENLDQVEYILSNSYRERSSILVKFIDDSDYRAGYDELRFKVQGVIQDLPSGIDPPQFNYLDVNDWFPSITVNVVGERNNRVLTLIAEDLKSKLSEIEDLKEIKLVGELTREFHLELDPVKLRALGLTFDQAVEALTRDNVIIPAGKLTTSGGDFLVRVDERFRTRDQVMGTVVRRDSDGSLVRISDLAADAYLSHRDPLVLSSVNGKDCISLQLIKTGEGNAVRIAEKARRIVEEIQETYRGDGVQLVVTQDSTVKIRDSMQVLGFNLLFGVVLVSLLIWSVMGLRNAALTTIGIPFSFLVTMAIMYVTGNSINEVSLFAFVLVSGVIVDDAIVIVENIYRHLQMGKHLEDAVVEGTEEVFLPVLSATLTTIAAFLPLLIMSGSIGEFFALIPKAVSYALVASLFEAALILPIHYVDFGPDRKRGKKRGNRVQVSGPGFSLEVEDTRFIYWNRIFFNRLLRWFLVRRWISLFCLGGVFFLGLVLFGVSMSGRASLIRITFFPDDYSLYYVEVDGSAGTPISTTHALVKRIAAEVMADGPGQAESAQGVAGFYINEDYNPVWGDHLGHVVVTLPALDLRHFADYPENDILRHLQTMRERLAHFEDGGCKLRIRAEKDGPPEGRDVNIRVLGNQVHLVEAAARRIMEFLRSDSQLARSLRDLSDNRGQPSRVLTLQVQRERIAEYGLTPDQVIALAASSLNGRMVGHFRLLDEEIDFKVKIAFSTGEKMSEALNLVLVEHPAGPLRLGDLVRPELSVEPGFLNRFQRQRAVTITGDLVAGSGVTSQMVVEQARRFFKEIESEYPGVRLNFSGEYESTKRSYSSLTWAFIIALLLIYLILAAQFSSYVQPLIIVSSIVFALTGVIWGTFFSRTLFTINSFIAIVGVTGVVVNDALVLLEFINASYAQGCGRHQAIIRAVNIRLRPILLTTLTTTLGLLPMALGIPQYSLVWGTMAMTFVTGLCTATLLTIVMVPVQWDLLAQWRERRLAGPGEPPAEPTDFPPIALQRLPDSSQDK